jgi:alpha-L-fucosidase
MAQLMHVCMLLGVLFLLPTLTRFAPQIAEAAEAAEPQDQRMAWWREARFGMFIHWGLYAIPAGQWDGRDYAFGEWIKHYAKIPVAEYAALAGQFNPTAFDADAIVRLAKQAGMRYVVMTAKHHDGFAMYHSRVSAFNIIDATPFDRDPLRELAEACRQHGLKFGVYFSHAQDWHHPGAGMAGRRWDAAQEGDMDAFLRDIAVPQLRELLTEYGDVAVLWWDTPRDMNPQRAQKFLPLLQLQPNMITNNRLGGGHQGDFNTPEGHIPEAGIPGRDWETCMTMNRTWGYKESDNDWKSARTLVHMLIECASKGGNFLLNIGPKADGSVPQASIERLEEVGRWMAVNGEAIYGTQASPFRARDWGRATTKADGANSILYLHVIDWPADGRLPVSVRNEVRACYLLADRSRRFEVTHDPLEGVIVKLNGEAPDPISSTVVLELVGPTQPVPLTVFADDSGVLTLPAANANIRNRGDARTRLERVDRKTLNIGFWGSPLGTAHWTLQVPRAGRYRAEALIAAHGESRLAVHLDGQSALALTTPATGGFTEFATVPLGELSLEAGLVELAIVPDPQGWRAINLREVILTPID